MEPSLSELPAASLPGDRETRHHAHLLVLGIMTIAWIAPGLFGHDPWKPDEGYTIGLINHMARTGDWVVPVLTGEAFLEKPPLFYISASLMGWLFSPWLIPLHQAAALAAGMYNALTVLFCYLAGRERGGREEGLIAAASLIGCLGFLVRPHSAITDVVLWSGFAVACYGMILGERRWLAGAFWFGTGVGMTFMAKGLQGPAFLGLAAALLPVFVPEARKGRYARYLIFSVVFCLPWLLVWPTALYLRSPEYFRVWFWDNNVGRFLGPRFGYPVLAQARGRWQYFRYFPWFTMPLWPPALLFLLRKRGRAFTQRTSAYPLLVFASGMTLLSMAAGQRELYMVPLLIPMAVLAARSGGKLPPELDWGLRRIPLVLFALCLSSVWAGWLGWRLGFSIVTEWVERRAPGLDAVTGWGAIILALLYGGLWCRLSLFRTDFRRQWYWVWAGGLTVIWGTVMFLFMPVLNHANSYQATFGEMVRHLPRDGAPYSIGNYRLGESQRAILEYYFGITTVTTAGDTPIDHDFYLVQLKAGERASSPEGEWTRVWEGTRPGDTKEWYTLFRRESEEG